jgi:hypothetical protein
MPKRSKSSGSSQTDVVPFPKRSAAPPNGPDQTASPDSPPADSSAKSGDSRKAAILLGWQMAESEARRMLAMKTQQALSSARGSANSLAAKAEQAVADQDPAAKRWAEEHRRFLEENNPAVLADLRRQGDLNSYLSSVGESANEMESHLMSQYLTSKEVQNLPFHDRVRALRSRQREVEELIRHDVILQPVPEGLDDDR